MKVGDQIQIQIDGGRSGVTIGDPRGASISIGAGASMSVGGVIIADLGNSWQVRTNMSIDGKDIINVPK